MKYVVLNDFNYFLKKNYEVVLYYLLTMLCFFLLYGEFAKIDPDFYRDGVLFSLKIHLKENLESVVFWGFMLLNYGFYIYLTIYSFLNDIDNCDNLFMRIKVSKWMNGKLISNVLLVFVVNTILYLWALMLGICDFSFYIVILKKIIITIIIDMYVLFIMLTVKRYKFLFGLSCLILIEACVFNFSIINISTIYILLLCVIFKLLLTVTCRNLKFSDLKG